MITKQNLSHPTTQKRIFAATKDIIRSVKQEGICKGVMPVQNSKGKLLLFICYCKISHSVKVLCTEGNDITDEVVLP